MATIKDFIVTRGLVVNSTIVVNGVDVLANDFLTYTTLNNRITQVESNAGTSTAYQANDYTTYLSALANDHNTYTTVIGLFQANDVATLATARGNDHATLLSAFANDLSTLNTARGNDHATLLSAQANDFTTFSTLSANDGVTLATARGNDHATLLSAQANDFNTLNTARANDWSTYTTLQSEYRANDFATFTTLSANDGVTLATARGNDHATLLSAQANDFNTLNTARANDWSTYTTLQGEYRANDFATFSTLSANDGVTLATARGNDHATLLSARANDWATYSTLVTEYQANDATTFTTLNNNLRANDFATWSGLNNFINVKANSSITITAGSGLSGGGDLSANRSLAVDGTVVRTTGDQTIAGLKTFSDSVVVSGNLTVNGNVTTISSTNLSVTDRFLQLASNTTGAPSADVGIYFNRGNQGNSAFYYDQTNGYFNLANSFDPASNTQVSPSSTANLRIGRLITTDSSLVSNLNADFLDSQHGSYYLDFNNQTNTNLITLQRVTNNGATTTNSITVGGLTVDTNLIITDTTNNRVGINQSTPLASLQVEQVGISTATLNTTTTTANQIIDTFPAANFRTAKYLIQVHDTVNNDYHASEILLIHDGTTVYLTEFAIVFSDISLATFDASILSGNVRLLVTPTTSTNTIKVTRTAIAV